MGMFQIYLESQKRCIFRCFYVNYYAVSTISFTFSGANMLNRIAFCCCFAATWIETDSALVSRDTTVEKMRPMFDGHSNRLLKVAII